MSDVWNSRSGQYKALSNVWCYAVDTATDERELLEAVRDFVSTWTPRELARLPECCRPGRMSGLDAIAELAFQLSKCKLTFQGAMDEQVSLDRMHAFFMHANVKAARLLAMEERLPAANQQ